MAKESQQDNNDNLIQEEYQRIKQLKQVVDTLAKIKRVSVLLNPSGPLFWIILFFILVFFITSHGAAAPFSQGGDENNSSSTPGTTTQNPIPGLSVNLVGPTQVNNGDPITYTISVTYSGNLDVSVIDPFSQYSLTYGGATGIVNQDPVTDGQVVWKLNQNQSSMEGQTYTFTVTLKSAKDDTNVQNLVYATAASPQTATPPNINASDFDTLMTGQGRNVNVLGNEDNFVSVLLKNGANRLPAGVESHLRQIYEKAAAKNVNPLIVVTIWGVESTFGTNANEQFNCPVYEVPFDGDAVGLSCTVNTLNNQMNEFEKQQNAGVYPVPLKAEKTCYYTDEFLYAYEAFTPVCATFDNNDGSRTNFVTIYKQLYGTGN